MTDGFAADMSVKSFIKSRIIQSLASDERLYRARATHERKRRARTAPHVIEYFHQADDPYSHMMVQALRVFKQKYDVQITPYLVSPPNHKAAPELQQLNAYAILDAQRLSEKSGLEFPTDAQFPNGDAIKQAQAELVASMDKGQFFEDAENIGTALWNGSEPPVTIEYSNHVDRCIGLGNALRKKRGHYLGAALYYAGEWYWGIDRLHYLEHRLYELGACVEKVAQDYIYQPPKIPTPPKTSQATKHKEVDFFFSFRSPYSYLSFQRTCDMADTHGVQLNLRFVLPMVMRGLPVPLSKRLYILRDAAREARRLGIPFGFVADPIGRPIFRGYSLLPWAMNAGKGREYCQAFMQSVWSEGVDAGSDTGLRKIVEQAGLSWGEAKSQIGNEDWVQIEKENRKALIGIGLWGVPSFGVGDHAIWGQDRLWYMDRVLRS